jgi:hypothetical protein
MKGDFSRLTFQPDAPYSSVRLQQGRVPVDADWNEQVDIDAYVRRRALRDVIGSCCIPQSAPDSFRVSLNGNGGIEIAGGRAWVGGVLCEEAAAQTLDAPESPGRYVVYLEVFERHVTAIEDPEIREIALGGPDTATRTATVCRARIAPVGPNDTCAALAGWTPDGQTTGRLNASTGSQPPETPCVVPAAAGYALLGNQLYRVEIQSSGEIGGALEPTFKWSRDNGSIAAEWLELDGNELVIPDAGRDDVLGFHDNRWVELSHDALDLAGEPGIMVEVEGRRTDGEGRYRLEFNSHGQAVPDPATLDHPKVRRWDQDAGSDPNLGAVPITAADTPIPLEGGVEVSFSAGFYRAGDYWLIPARTFSGETLGDILWPRDDSGTPLPQTPHGVTRYFCRLAVVTVSEQGLSDPEDCRRTFRSLCESSSERGGCCTVTVGVGGDVSTIGEALSLLPETGGEICLLPGEYRERITIVNRADITIRGCGPRARITAPDANPVISISGSQRIRIRSLGVESLQGRSVFMEGVTDVLLANIDFLSRDQTAILARNSAGVALLESRISLEVLEAVGSSRSPAVFLAGTDLRIEGNRITAPEVPRVEVLPGGGIQIGGGSEHVEIRRNLIDGGSGPGIALGSVSIPQTPPNFGGFFNDLIARPATTPAEVAGSDRLNSGATHFLTLHREPGDFRVSTDATAFPFADWLTAPLPAISDGDLYDVTITENEIRNMGSTGITVSRFFNLVDGEGEFISIHDLRITTNRIENCLRLRHAPLSAALAEDSAIGGIALADVSNLLIRDNDIERNGLSVANPSCGVFVLHVAGAEIHRNRVRHNGVPPSPTDASASLDRRGGIVIGFAEVPTRDVRLGSDETLRRRQDGTPAARVHDNVVVAPQGRALQIVALGPVSVQGNQFTALGADFQNRADNSPLGLEVPANSPFSLFTNALGGAVVLILNLGVSNEFYFQLAGFSGLGLTGTLAQPVGDDPSDRQVLAGGNIQFLDNQVVLDALDPVSTFALSAISLFTMDDVAMSGNQSDCDLLIDFALINALAAGLSLRASDNRFKEGVRNAFLSALTIGFLNTTTGNQGTHCFARVAPVLPAVHENTVLVQRLDPPNETICRFALNLEAALRTQIFGQ